VVVNTDDIVPVGKETDRTWDEAEDMHRLLDFEVKQFREKSGLVCGDPSLLADASLFSIRQLIRSSKLSQKAVYAVLEGKAVRVETLETLRIAVEGLKAAAAAKTSS
jgi:hypothetical protein